MWKPILAYAAIYSILFVAHIIAAANNFDMIFRLIALLITIQTLFAGYFLHLLGGNVRHTRIIVLFLSAGLGWAYAGMNESWTIVIWVVVALILQYFTERGLKYDSPTQPVDG
ncbi:MAG: hypothetical protein ACKVIR_02360 [Candidatus Poseidoniales archaeon]